MPKNAGPTSRPVHALLGAADLGERDFHGLACTKHLRRRKATSSVKTLLLAMNIVNLEQNSAAIADELYITRCATRHTPCRKITWLSMAIHLTARGVPDAGAMLHGLQASHVQFLPGAQR